MKTALKHLHGWLYLHSPRGRRELAGAGVILMLHRVLADDASAGLPHRNELCVGPRAFARLLRWLPRHFECVDLMTLLQGQPGSRPRVALTFDDGWRDNAEHAFPLLQRHGIPASIFLSTDFIGSRQRFWWESVGETLWGSQGVDAQQRVALQLAEQGRPVPPACLSHSRPTSRSQALAAYLAGLKVLPSATLQRLSDHCPTTAQRHALDWRQVRELEASGLVRFGPHGASHALLPTLDDRRLDEELQRSQTALQQGCAAPLPVYCYPNGDVDARVQARVAAHHYAYALGTRPGVLRAQSDPLDIPRICVSQRTANQPSLLAWRIQRGARS